MAEMKLLFFANFFGFSLMGIAPFVVDPWQRYILFALTTVFILQKIYFVIIKNKQEVKARDLTLKKKEFDVTKEIEEEE